MTERAKSIMNRAEIARLAGKDSIKVHHDLLGEEVYDLQEAGYLVEDMRPQEIVSEKRLGLLSNQGMIVYFIIKF